MKLEIRRSRLPKARQTNILPQPKKADPHYLSDEHRKWRLAVLRRDRFTCQKCGSNRGKMIADHIKERRDGGDDLDVANGMTLCQGCHNKKTAAARAKRFQS